MTLSAQHTANNFRCVRNNIIAAASSYKVVVIGGGTGGCSLSHWCRKLVPKGQVAVIDPADV